MTTRTPVCSPVLLSLALVALAVASGRPADAGGGNGLSAAGNSVLPSPIQQKGYFGSAVAVGDFDGDGLADLAVGANGDESNGSWAGRVDFFLSTGAGLEHVGSYLGAVESLIGFTLAVGDFDGDADDELAVAAVGDTVAGMVGAGRVVIFGWDAVGARMLPLSSFTQGMTFVGETPEEYDNFGHALASGDFNDDGYDDLAVGVPYERLGDTGADHGLVHVLYGYASGLTTFGAQRWTQDTSGVLGTAAASDQFGFALAAGDFDGDGVDDLAVGIPGEVVGASSPAGAVGVLYGTTNTGLAAGGNQLWAEGVSGLPGSAAAGDHFGWAVAAGDFDGDGISDLAVGAPDDDPGGVSAAGLVVELSGSATGLTGTDSREWTALALSGIAGGSGNRFGFALAAASFDGDARDDLAIASPYADVGGAINAGLVDVVSGSQSGLTLSAATSFRASELASAPAASADLFGAALATGDLDGNGKADLVVGIPNRAALGGVPGWVGLVQILRGASVLFADGLESGDASGWSSATP